MMLSAKVHSQGRVQRRWGTSRCHVRPISTLAGLSLTIFLFSGGAAAGTDDLSDFVSSLPREIRAIPATPAMPWELVAVYETTSRLIKNCDQHCDTAKIVALANLFYYLDLMTGAAVSSSDPASWQYPEAEGILESFVRCREKRRRLRKELSYEDCDNYCGTGGNICKMCRGRAFLIHENTTDWSEMGLLPRLPLALSAHLNKDPLGERVPLWVTGLANSGNPDAPHLSVHETIEDASSVTIFERSCSFSDGSGAWQTGGTVEFWLALLDSRVAEIRHTYGWPLDAATIVTIIMNLLL